MDLRDVTIETERLRLIPVSEKYSEQVFSEYNERVTLYMNHGPPESLDDVHERMRGRQEGMAKGTRLFMAVLLKDSEEFVGCFSLEDLDQRNPEMGGWLKESAHGNRYGQEAAAALKEWADKHLDYDHLIWPCATMNAASRKVAESLGGKIQREYEKKTVSGKTWPYVEYWIPRSQ